MLKDFVFKLNVSLVQTPLFMGIFGVIYYILLNVSVASCDSSNWDEQWIQGADLDKQPDWFKANTRDTRSLYDQMNGPAWRDIRDHYDIENASVKYIKPSSKPIDAFAETIADNTSVSNSDITDVSLKDAQNFVEEVTMYIQDLHDIAEQEENMSLYDLFQRADKSLWMPESISVIKDPISNYNATLDLIGTYYDNAVRHNSINEAEFCLNLGSYIIYDAFCVTENYSASVIHQIAENDLLSREMARIFLNHFSQTNIGT